jgi:RimJ/RimL family protein N-acetyltransferase
MLKTPINRENFEIETERLFLIPIKTEHDEDIFREFDIEVTKYMTPVPPKKIEDTQAFIEYSIQKNKNQQDIQLVIVDKQTQEFIGCI